MKLPACSQPAESGGLSLEKSCAGQMHDRQLLPLEATGSFPSPAGDASPLGLSWLGRRGAARGLLSSPGFAGVVQDKTSQRNLGMASPPGICWGMEKVWVNQLGA